MEDHLLYQPRDGHLKNNRRNYKSKKIVEHKKDAGVGSDSQKQLSKLLEKMLDLQKNALTYLERIAVFQDRQSKAMLKIAETLKSINELIPKKDTSKNYSFTKVVPSRKKFDNNKSEAQEKKVKVKGLASTDEKALFKTIKNMRNSDQTWNDIAYYLKKEKISTLTGNGTWSPNLALYFYKKMLSKISII